MEVTEEGIDNVIDNSDCMGLGLDDRCKHAVRHAAAQEKAVVFAYVALPLALTYCCLTRHGVQVSAAQGRFPFFRR